MGASIVFVQAVFVASDSTVRLGISDEFEFEPFNFHVLTDSVWAYSEAEQNASDIECYVVSARVILSPTPVDLTYADLVLYDYGLFGIGYTDGAVNDIWDVNLPVMELTYEAAGAAFRFKVPRGVYVVAVALGVGTRQTSPPSDETPSLSDTLLVFNFYQPLQPVLTGYDTTELTVGAAVIAAVAFFEWAQGCFAPTLLPLGADNPDYLNVTLFRECTGQYPSAPTSIDVDVTTSFDVEDLFYGGFYGV